MFRLMRFAHPDKIDCRVLFYGKDNLPFRELLASIHIPVLVVRGARALYNQFCHIRPDAGYLFARPHLVLWGIAARKAHIPVIVAAERGSADRLTDRIFQQFTRYFVDAYIANSKAARARLLESGISRERVFVAYNGIVEDQNSARELASPSPAGRPLIICVASIRPGKGQIILLEAIKLLRARFPGIGALLVGRDLTRGKFF
ncbi:MAG: glycosyltransferase, partial [Anaerolineales bacterium]